MTPIIKDAIKKHMVIIINPLNIGLLNNINNVKEETIIPIPTSTLSHTSSQPIVYLLNLMH